MLTRPSDLSDAQVGRALREGWALAIEELAYAPVGFGSHHWLARGGGTRWFVTVDDLERRIRIPTETRADAARRLSAALTAAGRLRAGGLDFVVAPLPAASGALLQAIDDRYVVALYPYVEGETYAWGAYARRSERLAVLERIVAVHAASGSVRGEALEDDFVIPSRSGLERTLSDLSGAWGPGPYGDDARRLVEAHRGPLRTVLARYDELVREIAGRRAHWVLTHGEPHRANTIDTPEGLVLIDWDTALLAPPERDLWALVDEDPELAVEYARRTGVRVDRDALQLYRLWWDLCEIALYVAELRAPHEDTEETQLVWQELGQYLDPTRWTGML